jgi:hypothetical protein
MYQMKLTIEDPLTSKKTKGGQGLREEEISSEVEGKFEVIRAIIRIKKVTANGRLVLRVLSDKHPEEIIKLINNQTF